MTYLRLTHDGWLSTTVEDAAERATMVALRIPFGNIEIARNVHKRSGSIRAAINVPLQPLALALAENWWQWLYEPYRPIDNENFKIRHRLDAAMHGYAFPALSLCSGGEQTLLVAWRQEATDLYAIDFMTPGSGPQAVDRTSIELELMVLVEEALSRLKGIRGAYQDLKAAWSRVKRSLEDPDEVAYCRIAGRLGIDPYDSNSPDLAEYATQISARLFDDISDAVTLRDLSEATSWVRYEQHRLTDAPVVKISDFGAPPEDLLDRPAYEVGSAAATALRQRCGLLQKRPHDGVVDLFGDALAPPDSFWENGPFTIRGLIQREGGEARIGSIARSARERHMSVCCAVYLAWTSNAEDVRATTRAFTREQTAARAFAREMLAPQDYLRSYAPSEGFHPDDIEKLAGELMCPTDTVAWQARNAGIPLWDVPLTPHAITIV